MPGKRGQKKGLAKGGSASQSTMHARAQAHQIATSEKAPLRVMLDNMMFWHNQSAALADEIQIGIDAMKAGTADEELLKVTDKLLSKFIAARQNAQSCAVDAAPYVHPKLQSVTIKPSQSRIIDVETIIQSSTSIVNGHEVETDDPDYRKNYNVAAVTPMRRAG